MKSFRHEFKGYNVHPSACNVHIYSDDGDHYILFENIGEGTSVTNASEQLATEIVQGFKLKPENCYFYETYCNDPELMEIDQIKYKWDSENGNPVAKKPTWIPENAATPMHIIEMFKKIHKF